MKTEISITGIPALVAEIRLEVARLIHSVANDESAGVAARLREVAFAFEAGQGVEPSFRVAAGGPQRDRPFSVGATHTYAILELPKPMWDEAHRRLAAAGYTHAFHTKFDGRCLIDMHGIALAEEVDSQ